MEKSLRRMVVGKGATGFLPLKPLIQQNYETSKSSKNGLFLPLLPHSYKDTTVTSAVSYLQPRFLRYGFYLHYFI